MKRRSLFAMVAMAVALPVALWAADRPQARIGQPAPDFALKDQNGKTVRLSDFKRKIIVLEWTNPGCPFVQRHYQQHTMTDLASEYKNKDVVWLAINSSEGDSPQANKQWVTQQHIGYPVLDDSKGIVARDYGAKSTPHMFIIDKTGKLAYSGGIDNDPEGDNPHRVNYVQKALEELLAGKPVSTPMTKSYGCGVHYAE